MNDVKNCGECSYFNGRYCFFHLRKMKEHQFCPNWEELHER